MSLLPERALFFLFLCDNTHSSNEKKTYTRKEGEVNDKKEKNKKKKKKKKTRERKWKAHTQINYSNYNNNNYNQVQQTTHIIKLTPARASENKEKKIVLTR